MKIRTVDVAGFANGGQVLPALYLASNVEGDTISNMWAGIQRSEILRKVAEELGPGVLTSAGANVARSAGAGAGRGG